MRPRLRRRHGARDEDRGRAVELLRVRRHQRHARVPTLPLTLVDGKPADAIPVLDRGLAFGDGLFRTMRVRAGRPLNWRWHRVRLESDCGTLCLPVPDEATLLAEIREVAPGDATVKLILTRGSATRGYAIPEAAKPTRIVSAFPAPSHAASCAEAGVAVRRCELVLSAQPRLAGAKTLNRLENVLARSEWRDPAISEGLLGDAEGHVVEGTMSNVFIAKDGRLATPALHHCGVVGAQRERLRELAAKAGVDCVERPVAWAELVEADEVFLSNSLIGIWPVARYEHRQWAVGPLTRRLQALVAEDDARA